MAAPASAAALTPLTQDEKDWVAYYLTDGYHNQLSGLRDSQIQLLLRALSPEGRAMIKQDPDFDNAALNTLIADLHGNAIDQELARIRKEAARRASLLHDLPGGMPHFPIQPWEREMEAWMDEHATPRDLPRWMPPVSISALIEMYEKTALLRHPNVVLPPERLHANAVMYAHKVRADNFALLDHFLDAADKAVPGTALWHYTVERMHHATIWNFLAGMSGLKARSGHHLDKISSAIYEGIATELERRERLAVSQGDRATLAQSGLVDHMSNINPDTERHRGGLDAAQIVGQFHSGLITPRRVPHVPLSGPIRSNAAVLDEIRVEAELAAEAAAAAAVANPAAAAAAAVNGLNRAARRMEELAESVAKRGKH